MYASARTSSQPAALASSATISRRPPHRDPVAGLGPGTSLDHDVRASLEARFGHDFSRVRVHADPSAAEAAERMGARAFTAGPHLVFGPGAYSPRTPAGTRLLAHELTHVVQQEKRGSAPTEAGEREAENAAERAVRGEAVTVQQAASGVQCYGHFIQECEEKRDLASLIWPGHQLALEGTANTLRLLSQSPLDSTVERIFLHYFKDIARLDAVKSTLRSIQSTLGGHFMYHCHTNKETAGDRNKEDKRCRHAQAYMNDVADGTGADLVLCMNRVRGFSVNGVARVIVHETAHRAGVTMKGFHPICNDATSGECAAGSSPTLPCGGATEDVLSSADSYGCLVERLATLP